MKIVYRILPLLMLITFTASSHATEQEELLKIKNTTNELIDTLVKEGIISEEKAKALMADAEQKADIELKQQEKKDATPEKGVVRIPYVPDFVREEIRQQVRAELHEDVVADLMAQAKNERWGMPDALPDWTRRFKFKGDFRLRYQSDSFSPDNHPLGYFDWQKINQKGGLAKAGDEAYLNTTKDVNRLRIRMRLGIDATITNNFKAGLRLATGNPDDPVSTNQTLGQYGTGYGLSIDQAYLKYDYFNLDGYPSMTLWGGRIPNPWFSTDLVYDDDLNFEGLASQFRFGLDGGDDLFEQDERMRSLFLTLGVFPLQQSSRYTDKWIVGGQFGTDLKFEDQSRFRFALAYYDYQNVQAVPNTLGSTDNDWSAPAFMQKGNTVARISNDVGETAATTRLVGLASDFNILNLTTEYDYSGFAPIHLIVTADYAKNLGFDKEEVSNLNGSEIDEQTTAYRAKFTLGWPIVSKLGDWQAFLGWRYIERDAVLDAFTDSDFHLGGTDAKGWVVGGKYGLTESTWLRARWLSTDEISGPLLGIDILQVDLNAKF
ncbi:Outer membrane receptor for ferric coprogen and ferric-rhodotorulic acid [hydrothermal vent metagenome]|uniref:Outer membrane receptor for ferric coprogen and ferric-rhodotorulic acid n=1 Tax=hydrothermal vent metagenome TaxID=652676 RepID=A0A3B1BEN5_9ZZZZ